MGRGSGWCWRLDDDLTQRVVAPDSPTMHLDIVGAVSTQQWHYVCVIIVVLSLFSVSVEFGSIGARINRKLPLPNFSGLRRSWVPGSKSFHKKINLMILLILAKSWKKWAASDKSCLCHMRRSACTDIKILICSKSSFKALASFYSWVWVLQIWSQAPEDRFSCDSNYENQNLFMPSGLFHVGKLDKSIWASSRENLSSGFVTTWYKPACSADETS